MAGPGDRRHCQLLETAQCPKEDSEPCEPEWERNTPSSRRARSCQSARRDQRSSIPRHAHAPAPSPSRRWSIRCISFALVTDGNLGTPLAPRFRLRFGCAPLHSGLRAAIRCAPSLCSAPSCRPPDRSSVVRLPRRQFAVSGEISCTCAIWRRQWISPEIRRPTAWTKSSDVFRRLFYIAAHAEPV